MLMAGSGTKNSQWKGGTYIKDSGYRMVLNHGHHRADCMGYVREHILIAESAIGKSLPENAVIHHLDGNPLNNSRGNLVICQDHAFHRRLHSRWDAYNACGHADWIPCTICRNYDSPSNLYIWVNKRGWITGRHAECHAARQRENRAKRKAQNGCTNH